jgi:2-dehydro-3-deoxyphosphogluconate aldolase/(4S)-4-hydroxy-2-oxoglutarate aldolase
MLIGAGTVRTIADAEYALGAGAAYLVSPGCDRALQEWAGGAGVAHLPGVLTPTELDAALQAGAPLVKLFPAGRMGAGYVADLLAPFPAARLVATGGIDAGNAKDFLDAGAAAVALSSALVPPGASADPAALAGRAARIVRALAPSVGSGAR